MVEADIVLLLLVTVLLVMPVKATDKVLPVEVLEPSALLTMP